jgi:phospholipid/cholesterol/gamma-HCH transport system ATP-binding protein
MIKVREINKSFSGKNILNNISFDISNGDSVAIIGQSGTGKSVLLKHLNGLLIPDSGNVSVDSVLLNSVSYNELQSIRKKMAMVFQFGALFDSMTVEDNIVLAIKSLTNLSDKNIPNRIDKSLDLVELNDVKHLMPAEISGGMKKRVGIARAIAINPEYILYDEPTTGLDPITTDRINQLIKKVSEKKKVTSIVVTHNMKTLKYVANKVIMLHEGNIIFNDKTEMLFKSNDKFIQYFVKGEK